MAHCMMQFCVPYLPNRLDYLSEHTNKEIVGDPHACEFPAEAIVLYNFNNTNGVSFQE